MTPGRTTWIARLRVIVPATFIAYGVYLIADSIVLAVVVGLGVWLLSRFLVRLNADRRGGDDGPTNP